MNLNQKCIVGLLSSFSFSGFLCLYLIKNEVCLFSDCEFKLPSYLFYIVFSCLCTWGSIEVLDWLEKGSTIKVEGNDIVPVEGNLIPSYIGMYVIALSLDKSLGSYVIIGLLFILWLNIGSVSYFNPFLSVFGYRFYAVKESGNKTVTLIINEKDVKQAKRFDELARVNNYTFFRRKK